MSINVSVVVPLFNKEKTILRAVLSVLKILGSNDELIVVDDGSTDGSVEEINSVKDSKFKLVKKSNGGVSSARNAGVALANNRYVAFLDADDIWHPGAISMLKSMIQANHECVMFTFAHTRYSPSELTDKKISEWLAEPHASSDNTSHLQVLSGSSFVNLYSKKNIIHSSTVCVEKDVFSGLGGFPEGVKAGEDIYMWLAMATRGSVAVSNVPLTLVERLPPGNAKRRDSVPYYMLWAAKNKSTLKLDSAYWQNLKKFLFYRGLMNCSGRALAGYRNDVLLRSLTIAKVVPLFLPVGIVVALCPAFLLKKFYNLKQKR